MEIRTPTREAEECRLIGVYDALLEEHMPPSFLVDENRTLVQSFAGASRYLRLHDGRLSTDLVDMLDVEPRVALTQALQRTWEQTAPVLYQGLRIHTADGEQVVNLSVRPIRDRRSGRLYALVSLQQIAAPANAAKIDFRHASNNAELDSANLDVANDVTQLKIAEAQAREAVQQRDRFLAILSHELRNPLSAILSAAQLFQLGVENGPEASELYDLIDRQAHHMAHLLDDLLDASRITQGKIAIRKETLELAAVVDHAIQAVQPMIDARGHELCIDRAGEPLCVVGDRMRLSQVVENLVTNAAKYTPDGGRITVSLGHEKDEAVLRVRDNGRGIPKEMLNSIFDLFVQSDNTLDRSDGGMGVGLTLAKSLIHLHGGCIVAHSDGPGRGSEFVIRLPSCSPVATEPEAAKQPQARGTRVLIVEDNPDSRETLAALLEMDGFEVVAKENGSETLESIRSHRPDVALIDIGLPGLDGYQVAQQIRKDRQNDRLRLIALTGYGRPEDRERVRAAGFDAHLVKPVRVEALYPHLTPREV